MLMVMKVTVAAIPPTYDKILEMDRRLRNFSPPPPVVGPQAFIEVGPSVFMRTWGSDFALRLC